jgi:hypothetical protein
MSAGTKRKRAIVPWKDDHRTRYIYFVRDSVTSKVIYVGQTLNIQGRWKAHARADSSCSMLRRYLFETVHPPIFELCEAFEEGVRGQADAWAVESYYISLHNTVHNIHYNAEGCNLTSGSMSSDPQIKAKVDKWLAEGYPRPTAPPPPTPDLTKASFQVAMLEDAIAGHEAPSVVNHTLSTALVLAKCRLATAVGDDLRNGIRTLAKSAGAFPPFARVTYDDACRDYLTIAADHVAHLVDLHEDDTIRHDLEQLLVQFRRSKLHFKEGCVNYGFLKNHLLALHSLLPAQARPPTREGTVRAIRARCRPGWRGLETVEAAIRHTEKKRDHPPPLVGEWTEEERRWFDHRIEIMHTLTPAGQRH